MKRKKSLQTTLRAYPECCSEENTFEKRKSKTQMLFLKKTCETQGSSYDKKNGLKDVDSKL
jgi:hypothetical protein